MRLVKPLLPRQFNVRFEPPRNGGEEALVFASERRRLVVRGHSFREFLARVVPLLDGSRTLQEIQDAVADVFEPQDVAESLSLLVQHQIVEDAESIRLPADVQERMEPQLNYLREVHPTPADVIERLAAATVTVVGMGALGAVAATALAAAGIGRVRCVDSLGVTVADPYLAQLFALDDVGSPRVDVVRRRILAVNPAATVETVGEELEDEAAVRDAVAGSAFVLGCVDPGLSSLLYRVNRACLAERIPWCAGRVTAFEGLVGPIVVPYETACYLCYQMRAVACAEDPEEALVALKEQDRRKADDSPHRENLAFGAGIVGHLLGLEAFKAVSGGRPPSAGRLLSVDMMQGAMTKHVVLRKPWCPDCFPA
jgi:bacteriocin biosynthesis cyclodehydratase domain-containing protein